jgi:hypothetical protein
MAYLFHGPDALTCTITGLPNLKKFLHMMSSNFFHIEILLKNLSLSFETLVQLT